MDERDKFRQMLKAEGFSDAEIESALNAEFGPATGAPADAVQLTNASTPDFSDVQSGSSTAPAPGLRERLQQRVDAVMKDPSYGNVLRSAASGATLGLSPKIRGLAAAAVPGGMDYDEAREAESDALREMPTSQRLTGELMGGLLTGGIARQGAQAGARGLSVLDKVMRSGAAQGGIEGFAGAEGDLSQKLIGAGKGAALGGVVGKVADVGMGKATGAMDYLRPEGGGGTLAASMLKTPDQRALSAYNKALEMDRLTPDALRTPETGYKPSFPGERGPKAADVGLETRRLANEASRAPSNMLPGPQDLGQGNLMSMMVRGATSQMPGPANIARSVRRLSNVEGDKLLALAAKLEQQGKLDAAEALRRQVGAATIGGLAGGEYSRMQ